MHLISTTLAELVRELRSRPPGSEKVKQPAVGVRIKSQIVLGNQKIPVWVKAVSYGGVVLSCSQAMKAAAVFDLLLSEKEKIACTVLNCTQNAPGVFSIDAKFV